MPEETWSLNEGMISDKAYLDMIKTILAEREAMLFHEIERDESDILVVVFVQTDRVCHMFYRGIDEEHPLYPTTTPEARGAIEWIYGEADRILGRTMSELADDDRLIVLSDHGFNPFRRSVHMNRWLVENGYMALKQGETESGSLFENVNWMKTKAYSVGLNGIYLNLAGRERLGIVRPNEVDALKQELIGDLAGFLDSEKNVPVISRVWLGNEAYHGEEIFDAPDLVVGYSKGYRSSWQTALGGVPVELIEDNNRNWSGDHLVDPALVPGVLFTSFELDDEVSSIADVSELIAEGFQSIESQ
jgi:predicted AlkP superfamily phosphohydrolase/phosphomutase